ncbi:MAG: EF-Tu/IF-2/RF-3 family GTPase [Candidatus Dormibacteria bacterium]
MVWFRKRANKQVNISDGGPSFSSLFGTQHPISEGFAMQVEDIFSIRGRGTVVTGKVANGKVTVGDTVRIGGNEYETECRVEGIEVFHATLTSAEVGMNVGILFRSLDRKSVERGMWVRSA